MNKHKIAWMFLLAESQTTTYPLGDLSVEGMINLKLTWRKYSKDAKRIRVFQGRMVFLAPSITNFLDEYEAVK
jgi:hypothetical protein